MDGTPVQRLAILDHEKADAPIDLMDGLRHASSGGKSLVEQVLEIWRLGHGMGKLTAQEYFSYRLYDDACFSKAAKARFIGKAAQDRILQRCTNAEWVSTAHDKLVFHALMREHDLPVPSIRATYHPYRTLCDATSLRTKAELAAYLREGAECPFFSKPFDGMYSVGSARVEGRDPASGELVTYSGVRCSVEEFADALDPYASRGYLFQEVKHPHERIADICGDRLATMRVVVMVGSDGPELYRAVWKIPAGANASDNFWRPGNLLAGIDTNTGTVVRVVTGTGPAQVKMERHPDTGTAMVGFVMPHWEQVKALCLRAATVLYGLTLQAWDVAVCQEGPVLIEANVGGDFNLPQIATGAGLLDERFERYLADAKYEG
ncbi:MAG TPA: sugar-transfer associated ATP-grasp domain-containing protein [Gemmatimonadaceae bacterium]|nr:sugar-transfer associated ATP-grasp domain-containing protein [Gemmatimonadaceae bacterium]